MIFIELFRATSWKFVGTDSYNLEAIFTEAKRENDQGILVVCSFIYIYLLPDLYQRMYRRIISYQCPGRLGLFVNVLNRPMGVVCTRVRLLHALVCECKIYEPRTCKS